MYTCIYTYICIYIYIYIYISVCFWVFLCVNLCHIHIVRMQCCARCVFFRHSYGPFIASTLPLRKPMLLIIASWHPGFSPKSALPIDRKAGVIGTGSVIGLPVMPSWLCNVRRKATEDWLTALKCQPVGTDGTIKGSPSPRMSQCGTFHMGSAMSAVC